VNVLSIVIIQEMGLANVSLVVFTSSIPNDILLFKTYDAIFPQCSLQILSKSQRCSVAQSLECNPVLGHDVNMCIPYSSFIYPKPKRYAYKGLVEADALLAQARSCPSNEHAVVAHFTKSIASKTSSADQAPWHFRSSASRGLLKSTTTVKPFAKAPAAAMTHAVAVQSHMALSAVVLLLAQVSH